MAEETSEYSGTADDAIGRFGEMSMDAQIAEASGMSGIVECVTELPEPSEAIYDLGKTYQLIAVQPPYVMGRFYKCLSKGSSYVMWDVSEKEAESLEPTEHDVFNLDGNVLTLHWTCGGSSRSSLIKSEIQLVYHDAAGVVKSVKTIFTKSSRNTSPRVIYGATVIVDGYTADSIAQGKITLRVRSTSVGRVYVCDLPKVS